MEGQKTQYSQTAQRQTTGCTEDSVGWHSALHMFVLLIPRQIKTCTHTLSCACTTHSFQVDRSTKFQ